MHHRHKVGRVDRRLVFLAITMLGCGMIGPTGPTLVTENIFGTAGPEFSNTLMSFKADGNLTATITFAVVPNSHPPFQCNAPLEAHMILVHTPFPAFCFVTMPDCNTVVAEVHGTSPLQLSAQVSAGQYDEIDVRLGPASQPSNCAIEYSGNVIHP
jgi:hypothetical protein